MRRYDDLVEVRRIEEEPEQFLWRGRLWKVREVVAHWVETGSWWAPRTGAGGGAQAADPLQEKEVWRVTASRGRAVHRAEDPGFGVFDLSFDWAEGAWRLARAVD